MLDVLVQSRRDRHVARRLIRNGRSMEEEARDILRSALAVEPPQGDTLVESIRRRIVSFGGVELDLPAREAIRDPDGFSA